MISAKVHKRNVISGACFYLIGYVNAPCWLPLTKATSFMQPHREILYALRSTVVYALLGLEEGEEAANVCSPRTHLCIASFLPAFAYQKRQRTKLRAK